MVIMSFSSLKSIVNAMYTDKLEVWRLTDMVNPDTGSSYQAYAPVAEMVDKPCRLSYDKYGQADKAPIPEGDENPISFQPVIFFPNEYDVRKGDKLVVKRLDAEGNLLAIITGISALPSFYPLGKQVYMSVEES